MNGLFPSAGRWLDTKCTNLFDPALAVTKRAKFGQWLGENFLMVGKGEDVFLNKGITILKEGAAKEKWGLLSWWKALDWIPKPIRTRMGALAHHVRSEVPWVRDLPSIFKIGAVFSTFGIVIDAVTGAYKGFTQTQGNVVDKATGALTHSAQQAGRSTGILAATTAAALFIPKLLFGLPVTTAATAATVIIGQIASMVAEKYAGQFFDKAMPKTSENPQQALQAKAQANTVPVSQNGADMVRFMEHLDRSSKLGAQAHNPFIEAIPGSQMAMNDAEWTKLMKAAS